MRHYALLLALLVAGSATVCAAQGLATPTDNAAADQVSQRLRQLEAETQALRAEVERLREQPIRLPPTEAAPASMPLDNAVVPPGPAIGASGVTMAEVDAEIKKFAWRKGDYTITPYGCLWGNMVNSTERTNPGSYTLFVCSESTGPEDEFIIDGRNTRLGMDILGPKISWLDDAQTGGKVEIDFQQTVLSTENKASVLLRHAYVEAKNDDYRLVAGQTWDVISPLFPCMLMYSVGWDAGDIGYRRAQFRGERFFHVSDTSLITAQLSVNQNIFPDAVATMRTEAPDWPIIMGRLAWTVGERAPGCLPITIGVSGHIGTEQFDLTTGRRDIVRRTWSGNVDLRVPITERFGFQGEMQVGENLAPFLGGIGQGIDPTELNTIRDAGGWFEVWYRWTPALHSHVGYSIDDPNNYDLHTVGEKSYNQFYFGNLVYDVTKTFMVGAEVSSWKTLYVGQLPGDSVRCEFVVKYGF